MIVGIWQLGDSKVAEFRKAPEKPFLNSGKSATSDAFWPLFGPFFTFLKKNQRIYILIFNFFSGWITILNINPGSIALGSPLIRIQRYKQNHLQFPEVRKLRKQATNAPKCFLNSATLGTFEHTNSAVADFRNE